MTCTVVRPTRHQVLALPDRARNRLQARFAVSFHRGILWTLVLAVLSWSGASPGAAEEVSREQMRGLDEQVQEIKSDVLSIAAELRRLEETLLYPSNTQLAVFVSLAEGESFRLDSVRIQIDGELVAHHIYSFKELEALQAGGVQRLFMGNLPTGAHRLQVSVIGKLTSGRDFQSSETLSFEKGIEPSLLGITVSAASGNASIALTDW